MAEWRDGSKFTLCLALECRERDPSRCVYQPSWAKAGSWPSFHCGAVGTHRYTQTHTDTNATAIIYTVMHVHASPDTVFYLCQALVHTVARVPVEHGPSSTSNRGIGEHPFSAKRSLFVT